MTKKKLIIGPARHARYTLYSGSNGEGGNSDNCPGRRHHVVENWFHCELLNL